MDASIKNPALRNIAIAVIALHLIVLGWAAVTIERHIIQKNSRPLVVKTISLQPAEAKPMAVQAPAKPTPVKKEVKKTPPKPKSKPQPKAETIKSPKIEKKENQPVANAKLQGLLAKAQANMDKVQKNPEKLSAIALAVPQWTAKESSYQEELSSMLKLLLRLPEFGQVQIELTLDRLGNVKKIKVVKSESDRNRAYIENAITALSFPPFGHHFSGSPEHTFHIKLDNKMD